jgi:chitinase
MRLILTAFSLILIAKLANCQNPTVVCYWPNWSKYNVSDINPNLCTHIHYSFFILNETRALPVDSIGHANTDVYSKLNQLKTINPNVKIIASIGGGGDASEKYSRVVGNDTTRHTFVQNAYQLVLNYSFDGFDLDWEFPVCWQDNCTAGDPSDKENFSKLIQVSILL